MLSALVAMALLALSLFELSRTVQGGYGPVPPTRSLRFVLNLQLGTLVTIAIGVSATLVAVRWLGSAMARLTQARDEIARVNVRLHEEMAAERLLEHQLVDAARHWAATFDAIDAVIAVVDEDGRLLRLNRHAAALLGGLPPDLVGLKIDRWADSEPWRGMAELLARPVGGSPVRRRTDRAGRTWEVGANYDPDLSGTVFLARDETDLAELRAQLERRRHGEEMGTFVAGVAHEVRNPLFSITANLQALQEEPDKAAVFDEYFGWIQSSAIRLQMLMQDLLDYARPVSPPLIQGSLLEVIERSVAACLAPAHRAGIALRVESAADLPGVPIDPRQVEQVFRNLIENAIALAPAQSAVHIFAYLDATAGVICTIEDEGPGFSPEEIERGFEPFFTRRKGGTGLGLAVVRRIMDGHGGSVELGNREPEGARVRLVFPLGLPSSSANDSDGF